MASWHPRRARDGVVYWLEHDEEQNFGDSLTEFLLQKLFVDLGARPSPVRLIGSCLDDDFVDEPLPGPMAQWAWAHDTNGARRQPHLIAWGLGVRRRDGLSPEHRARVDVLSVRGPVSQAELGPDAPHQPVPIGDPGLLLPLIHTPATRAELTSETLVVPHFHDQRSDQELLAESGCSRVLRARIEGSIAAMEDFVDQLTSARFVLCGALHGAVTAAAYGRPFAFWDSGNIDLPVKWEDFATSIGITASFARDLAEGERIYADDVAPNLRLPSLWETLSVAPFLVRPEVLVRLLRHELDHLLTPELAAEFERREAVVALQRGQVDDIAAEPRQQLELTARRIELLEGQCERAEARIVELERELGEANHPRRPWRRRGSALPS